MSTNTEVGLGFDERISAEDIPGLFQKITFDAHINKSDGAVSTSDTRSFRPQLEEPEVDGLVAGPIAESRMFINSRRIRLHLEEPMPPMSSINGQFPMYVHLDIPYSIHSTAAGTGILLALPSGKPIISTDATCFHSQLTPSEQATRAGVSPGSRINCLESVRVDADGVRQTHETRATYIPGFEPVTRPEASDEFHLVVCGAQNADTISQLTVFVPERVSLESMLAGAEQERRQRLEEGEPGRGSCAFDLRGPW
ncbi:hypothetical protein IAR50_000741 [Cryptococcus sp. DSM 104548]